VGAMGCDSFLRIRRMSSAIWAICRRKVLSKPAAYSCIFPPSTSGTQTWAFPNLLLAKLSTCSVEGTVRCKEMRMTRLCGLGDLSSIDMYNNDVGKESAQKFMKQTGDLKAATLYFAS